MQEHRHSHELEHVLTNLKVGDIMLVHTRRPLSRWIRRASNSYWSHVALVFQTSEEGEMGHDHLIIEALEGSGVQMHRLSSYLDNPWKYSLGFKRMKHLSDEERDRFRGFFLDAVDTPYDSSRLGAYLLGVMLLRMARWDFSALLARRSIDVKRLVCTTFAQRAYYLAVAPERRLEVLFRGHEQDIGLLEQMEVITPRDIAGSPVTEWLYNPRK